MQYRNVIKDGGSNAPFHGLIALMLEKKIRPVQEAVFTEQISRRCSKG